MMYIIANRGSSNAQILKRADDGNYEVIAFTAGDSNLKECMELVRAANKAVESND